MAFMPASSTKISVFYRTPANRKPKLRQIDVTTDDHEVAISSVASQLKMDMENYIKPILAVIQGGKQ
jgi:hypothetical protein